MIATDPSSVSAHQDYSSLPLEGVDDLLALHHLNPERYPHLLESVTHGTAQARYNILFAFPAETLKLKSDGCLTCNGSELESPDFLDSFDFQWKHAATKALTVGIDLDHENPPFRGGWFVFLAYEFLVQIERKLNIANVDENMPLAFATRFPSAIIYDHLEQKVYAVSETTRSQVIFEKIKQDCAELYNDRDRLCLTGLSRLIEDDPEQYINDVERIKHYIKEGDVFQVNLSRQWQGALKNNCTGGAIYDCLRKKNPAPFAGLMSIDAVTHVICSSPERLVSINKNKVSTRPIAGTHPRGDSEREDHMLSVQLLSHPKERAEHIMLIDLERSDLGRVCETGSIDVNEFMVLESYAHVHHIVSEVTGTLRNDATPASVIKAVFPGGTITGCPKVRCMEIISELESTPRGAYTGSMGYVNHNGDMDLNILIRTLTKKGKNIYLRAGSGIVADSLPERELEETRAKAKGLLSVFDSQTS